MSNVYKTCNLEHNSKTFKLPVLSVLSEESCCLVKMVCGAILCFNILTRLQLIKRMLQPCFAVKIQTCFEDCETSSDFPSA